MAYSRNMNENTKKYVRQSQKRIEIKFLKSEYEEVILPAVERSGETIAGYIKAAVRERIERDEFFSDCRNRKEPTE